MQSAGLFLKCSTPAWAEMLFLSEVAGRKDMGVPIVKMLRTVKEGHAFRKAAAEK